MRNYTVKKGDNMKIVNKLKIQKFIAFIASVVVLLYVYLINTDYNLSETNILFVKDLEKAILTKKEKILLSNITDFKWGSVCIHGPYSGNVYEWTEDSTYWTLVFYLKDGSAVPIAISRGLVDPIYPKENEAFKNSEGEECFDNHIYIQFLTKIRQGKYGPYEIQQIQFIQR